MSSVLASCPVRASPVSTNMNPAATLKKAATKSESTFVADFVFHAYSATAPDEAREAMVDTKGPA